jgi:hypothetical protein
VVEIPRQRRQRWINGEKWRTSNAIPLAYVTYWVVRAW